MKGMLHDTAVLAASRCIGFVSVMVLAALPAVGAGSAKQTVRQDSDPSITIYNQGVELMLAKRFPEAQAKFEQALKENPRFAEAHNNLGYTLRKQKAANYQKSLEHYNTAIELKPMLAEAYMYRGVLYTEMGRKSDAQADLATLQKLNPQLAKELAEVIKTGQEEDRFYGLSSKLRGSEFKGSTRDIRIHIQAPGRRVFSELGEDQNANEVFGRRQASILASDLRVGCVTGNVFLLTVIPQEGEMPIGMLN